MITTYQKSLTLTFLTLGLIFFPLIAHGDYSPPPQQERAGDYSKSMGVRTGYNLKEKEFTLTIIAPQAYVGKTASVRPSFVWFVGNKNKKYEVDFRLFEFNKQGEIKQRGQKIRFQQTGGINYFSFPSNQTPLEVGKKYLWQVAIRKNSKIWIIQRAEFKVVELSNNLSQQLANTPQRVEKAEIYAKNGLWYDALTMSLKSKKSGELTEQTANFIQSLVASDYLDESEGVEAKIISRRNDRLMKLVKYFE